MRKYDDEYTQKFYDEYVKKLAELAGFDPDYIDIESMKKSNMKENNEFDIYEFTYKDKKYIYDRGKINEIKK